MSKPTQNRGAAIERAAIKRHIQRIIDCSRNTRTIITLHSIITFINLRTKRNAKRKGGLGRR